MPVNSYKPGVKNIVQEDTEKSKQIYNNLTLHKKQRKINVFKLKTLLMML